MQKKNSRDNSKAVGHHEEIARCYIQKSRCSLLDKCHDVRDFFWGPVMGRKELLMGYELRNLFSMVKDIPNAIMESS